MRPSPSSPLRLASLFAGLVGGLCACSSSGTDPGTTTPTGGGAGGQGAGGGGQGAQAGSLNVGGTVSPPPPQPDPTTCEEAALGHTYVGCDFWPTVLDNIVRPDFDYVVVAANAGDTEASVTVTRGDTTIGTVTVGPKSLRKMFLPWVPELKGMGSIAVGCPTNLKTATVLAKQGAYHVTSTRPIALYQFNALEYGPKGGPAGKDWDKICSKTCLGSGCFSYTNDASLLLPSTALGTTYRIAGAPAWKPPADDPDNPGASSFVYPPYFSVTAMQDDTKVQVKLSASASIAGGSGLADVAPGGTASFVIQRGDVVLLVGKGETADFSGSLVTSSAPVQVLTGIACTNMPHDKVACDHLEESVLPAETLGRRYFVTTPSGPAGVSLGHVVRLYGNVDGTQLTYPGLNPGGPATLDAGQVVDLGLVAEDFEVVGDHEFTVSSFQVGAGPTSGNQKGDPAQSFAVTIEQYRTSYVFLAPDDYDESYADVVMPADAQLTLDGAPLSPSLSLLSSGYAIARLPLGPGQDGAHTLTASAPVGLQVMGYGAYTSYQYPGGLNLGFIAPAPIK